MPSDNMQRFYKFVAAMWGSDAQTYVGNRSPGIYNAQQNAVPPIEPADLTVIAAAQAIMAQQYQAAVDAITGVAPNSLASAAPDSGDVHSSAVRVAAANTFAATTPTLLQTGVIAGITASNNPNLAQITSRAVALANASNKWTLALKEYDIDVPRNRVIFVHRNTRFEYHYVVPEPPGTNPANLEDHVELAMTYVMTDS